MHAFGNSIYVFHLKERKLISSISDGVPSILSCTITRCKLKKPRIFVLINLPMNDISPSANCVQHSLLNWTTRGVKGSAGQSNSLFIKIGSWISVPANAFLAIVRNVESRKWDFHSTITTTLSNEAENKTSSSHFF